MAALTLKAAVSAAAFGIVAAACANSSPQAKSPDSEAAAAEKSGSAPQEQPDANGADDEQDKHCCRAMNECKGKGGCKVEGKHSCQGLNDCKGLGGCNPQCPDAPAMPEKPPAAQEQK